MFSRTILAPPICAAAVQIGGSTRNWEAYIVSAAVALGSLSLFSAIKTIDYTTTIESLSCLFDTCSLSFEFTAANLNGL